MWGNNEKGQIGNGTKTEQVLPFDITSNLSLSDGEEIKDFDLSNLNSAVLTTNNRLFIWGDNTYGQIGNESLIDSNLPIDITTYFELNNDEFINKISLGTVHTAALTSQGNLYTWGFNDNGLLGNQSTNNLNKPTLIMDYIELDNNEFITNISAGGSHSSFLTSDNNLYVWGINLYGELGNNTTESLNSPTKITDLLPLEDGETIKFSSLGITNSFIVTSQEKIYSWGNNIYGELGINSKTNTSTPTQVHLFKIKLIYTENYNQSEEISLYIPARENYEIKTWYVDKNLSIEFDMDNFSKNNIKLYGHWTTKEELIR